ncbi:MAG: glutaminyl-peptide cyclotransferase [Dehalogenimonas sp.]
MTKPMRQSPIEVSLKLLIIMGFVVIPAACTSDTEPNNHIPSIISYTYRVINTYPHDPDSFTQGLVYRDGFLYESTGLYGSSSLRKVDPVTGQVAQMEALAPGYFGEGLTLWQNSLIQLTWRSHTGFVYDESSFEMKQSFNYDTEGWGLTHDGSCLIMSDGTATLYFLDPATLAVTDSIEVHDSDTPVERLNELEYVNGKIYANVWLTNKIVVIDPNDGRVTGWIDLTRLLTSELKGNTTVDTLNGIAYDAAGDRLFVTGKLWPWLFEIELIALP